ncbi:MAG: glycosyltransferase family 87 protein [Candidatus Omnitrophota bacterium]
MKWDAIRQRWAERSAREKRFLRALFAALVLYTVYQYIEGTFVFNAGTFEQDFTAYYAAAMALNQGQPIYNSGPWPLSRDNPLIGVPVIDGKNPRPHQYYLYPPFLAWSLRPLSRLPFWTAEWIWNILMAAAYWLGAVMFLRCAARSLLSRSETAAALILAAFWAPMFLAFRVGQITIMVMAALALHYVWAINKRDGLSGLALGVAAALKVTPLFFLPLWFFWRRWKIVVSALITLIIILLITGWRQNLQFVTGIMPQISLGENHPINHTLMGVYLGQVLKNWGWLNADDYRSIAVAHTLMRLLLMAGWIATWWGAWRPHDERTVSLGFACALAASIIWTPVARLHDYIYLYPALILLYIDLKKANSWLGWAILVFSIAALTRNLSPWLEMLSFDAISREILIRPHLMAAGGIWGFTLYRRLRLLYGR